LTKDDKKNPSRTKEQIIEEIKGLYEYAKANPDKEFLVAYSSTGKNLNHYTNEQMAEMFASLAIPSNIVFEEGFSKLVYSNPVPSNKKIKGENISSKGSPLARKLTNPGNDLTVQYKGRTFRNAEHAY
jgi:hypothetical protein